MDQLGAAALAPRITLRDDKGDKGEMEGEEYKDAVSDMNTEDETTNSLNTKPIMQELTEEDRKLAEEMKLVKSRKIGETSFENVDSIDTKLAKTELSNN